MHQALRWPPGTSCETWVKWKRPLFSRSLYPKGWERKLSSKQRKTIILKRDSAEGETGDVGESNHQNGGSGAGGVREIISQRTTRWHWGWDKWSAMWMSVESQDSPGERIPECRPQSGPGQAPSSPGTSQERSRLPWQPTLGPRKPTQEPSRGGGGRSTNVSTFEHTRYHATASERGTASLFHPPNYATLKF